MNNKKNHIGYYDTFDEAVIARKLRAKDLYGEFVNSCEHLIKNIDKEKEELANIAINLLELIEQ